MIVAAYVWLIILGSLFIGWLFRVIIHYIKVKTSDDYKIALGIYKKINHDLKIEKVRQDFYKFELEEFLIKIEDDSKYLWVDQYLIKVSNESLRAWGLLPDPGKNLIKKITKKLEDILNKEKNELEEMTKKDALITFSK